MDLSKMPDMYAWLGEDEFGSGEVGLKQLQVVGAVPPEFVALVSVNREKVSNFAPGMQKQAAVYGKTIRLCRYVMEEVLITVTPKGIEHGQTQT